MNHKIRQNERDEQIFQLSTLVAGEFSLREVLEKLAEAAVKITNVKACSIRLLDGDTGDLKMRSTYGLSEEYRNKGPVTIDDPVIKAAFQGQAVVIDDMHSDNRVQYKEATENEGLVSQLTVSMRFKSKPIGVLRLYTPVPQSFDEDDISLARAVASQCAIAITNARLYNKAIEGSKIAEQMRLAGIIQRRMIPQNPPLIPGVDICAKYIPCFDVGGDFYDLIPVGKSSLIVTIADVIGKGIPAALMMSMFRGAVRAYADTDQNNRSVKNIIYKLNRLACSECRDGEFITMFYALIDIEKMTMTFCNCGHEPTVLIRNKKWKELTSGGLVLGVDPDTDYEIRVLKLKDGDSLLFYTDGLPDAANFESEFWERERLLDTAVKFSEGSAKNMLNNILAYRRRFVGLARQTDDTSLIVVKTDRTAEPEFMEQVN